MKKNMNVKLICAAALVGAVLLPLNVLGAVGTVAATADYIGEVKAQAIALEHAGVTAEQAVFIETHLDRDDGRIVYDVEFYSGNVEYDYEIDAVSGIIQEFDKDIEYYSVPADTSQYIGEEKAKATALADAGLSAEQVTFTRSRLDYDDGRASYKLKFFSGSSRYEYDYEIDALSGEIRDFGMKTELTAAQQATANDPSQYIGEEKAKASALADAGLTEAQIRKMKVKLDREHGRMVYEVEFKDGWTEYDYEIDPISGTILKSDVEYDD